MPVEKQKIEKHEVGKLEDVLGSNDPLFQSYDCGKPGCKKDCCGKPNYEDHCMRGMFCVHCGRAFCIQDGPKVNP